MKKKVLSLVCVAIMSMTLSSCEMLQSVANQAASLANLVNCEYSLKNVSNLTIGGVNIKGLTNGNVTAADIINLTSALVNKKIPMNMDVNIDIKNPTENNAALTAMDWILDIDNSEFAQGNSSKNYTIKSKATTAVPLAVNTDLYSMFSSKGIEAVKTFIKSFSKDGTSSKVGLRIKPSLNVGSYVVPLPNYIKVEKKTGTTSNS